MAANAVENLRLEDLPEIPDDEDEDINISSSSTEEEPTTEERLREMVLNLLHKSSAMATKAMKDLEKSADMNEHAGAIQIAYELVQSIRHESRNQLDFQGATPIHLVNFLLARCGEERVNLKKSAICTIQALFLRLRDISIVDACVEKLSLKCRDLALAVRKQAAQTLTRLLQGTPEFFERIHTTWLHSVMQLILDREPGVQLHCAKLISEVLIEPIVRDSSSTHDEQSEQAILAWRLLAAIEEEAELRRLLLRSLVFLQKEKSLPSRLVKVLLNHTSASSDHSNSCWMLLSELAAFLDVPIGAAIEYWSDRLISSESNRIIAYIAKLIANRTNQLSFQQRQFLKSNVADALTHYRVHPAYISSVYFMFARVLNGIDADSPGHVELTRFNQRWYGRCLKELETLMYVNASPTTLTDQDEHPSNGQQQMESNELIGSQNEHCEKLTRLITSVGECVQYTPALISKQIFKLLQVIIASDVLIKACQSRSDSDNNHASSAIGAPTSRCLMSPNTSFNTELPTDGGGTHSNAPSEYGTTGNQQQHFQMRINKRIFRSELMTKEVRAQAVLSLGRLCLLDEQLAKKCIPVFIRQLKENNDHVVRNNIVVVVCDLCIRYTSQVDRYSTILASCLWDRSLLVRRHTLLLLTNLIKEQYLKWEGPIIYRFVITLLDPDPGIQSYANFCLSDILLPQFRERMFFHRFLECVFTFNGVKHASWISRDPEGSELNDELERHCSLEGREKFDMRMRLYKYMLKTFDDVQKVSILEKIGLEVFVPIVEGGMKLSDVRVRNLLFDAFKIMSVGEIKLKMQLGKMDVDYEGDEEEPPEVVKTAAKKIISSTFRRSIAETVMPHLFAIKAFLTERESPLRRQCYSVILHLCRDHEEQLDDFLASDPQLKAEIKFDLKRLKGNN